MINLHKLFFLLFFLLNLVFLRCGEDGSNGNPSGPFSSCLSVLANNPSASDGMYDIDPDGEGAIEPFSVFCDMTTSGGGWTRLVYEDYESGSTIGWINNTISLCGSFGNILGGYNVTGCCSANTKVFSTQSVTHTEARVKLDFIKIDSWDGGEAGIISLDGTQIFNSTFCSAGCDYTGGVQECGSTNAGWIELSVPVEGTISHSNNTISLSVTSTLNSLPSEESFGFDNVELFVR